MPSLAGIKYKSKEVMAQSNKTLIKLHLDYCVQLWKDVNAESVQRRFIRMLPRWSASDRRRDRKAGLVFIGAEKAKGGIRVR